MSKIATIAVTLLFICGMTFVAIPSALSFEDYITSESNIQEEAGGGGGGEEGEEAELETEEAPDMGEGGLFYDMPADEQNEIGEQETIEQEEDQETEQNIDIDDEEQGEMK
jgi:hypothetical protein